MSDVIEKVYVGIDVSKKTVDVFADGRSQRFGRDGPGLVELAEWIGSLERAPHAVLEPTGGYELAVIEKLVEEGLAWSRPHPLRVRRYAQAIGLEAKTDKIDAKLLAGYGERFAPKAQTLPSPRRREAAELMVRHAQLVRMVSMEKTHSEHVSDKWILKRIESSIRRLERDAERVLLRVEQLLRADPQDQARLERMTSVKGVGRVTSLTLLVQMPELGTLNRSEIASLAGLAPVTRQSGQWKGRCFLGSGRHRVRRALYLAALSASRYNDTLKVFYQRLREAGKPPKLALCAVARKLLTALNSLIRNLQTA